MKEEFRGEGLGTGSELLLLISGEDSNRTGDALVRDSDTAVKTPSLKQNLAEIVPSSGKFGLKKNSRGEFWGSFEIKNISDVDILFKIKTNAFKTFQAYPVIGFLNSSASVVKVTVKSQVQGPGVQLPSGKERFQVQVIKIPEKKSSNLSTAASATVLSGLWKEVSEIKGSEVEAHDLGIAVKSDAGRKTLNSSQDSLASCNSLSNMPPVSGSAARKQPSSSEENSSEMQELRRKVDGLSKNIEFKDRLIKDLRNKLKLEQTSGGGGNGDGRYSSSDIRNGKILLETVATNKQGNLNGTVEVEVETKSNEESNSTQEIREEDVGNSVALLNYKKINRDESILPFRYALLRTTNVVELTGDPLSKMFFGTFSCQVDFDHRYEPICVTLFRNESLNFGLQVCFPRQDFGSGFSYGTCILQIRFLNSMNLHVHASTFQIDAMDGTCTLNPDSHTKYSGFHFPTFKSDYFIEWKALQEHQCLIRKNHSYRDVQIGTMSSTIINVEIDVTFMRPTNATKGENLEFPTSFSNKLENLIHANTMPGPVFNERTLIKFGKECLESYIIFTRLLVEYSPVVELLTKEKYISSKLEPVEIKVPQASKDSMKLFYEYLHGRDDGVWLDNVNTNIQLLNVAYMLFIPELAQTCVRNIMKTPDDVFVLETAMAVIQTGRRCHIKCLEDRGIHWMEKKKHEFEDGQV